MAVLLTTAAAIALVVLSPHLACAHATGSAAASLSLAELAGVRQTETVSVVLQCAGVLTLDDLRMLDEEELSELKAALMEGGVVLSDRARLRQLWKMDHLESISHPALEETKTQPHKVAASRQLQQEKADGDGASVETLAIVLTGVLGIVGCVLQNIDLLCFL